MGEARRKRDRLTPVQLAAEQLTHELTDKGLLVSAGFVGFMAACFPDGCPPDQRQEMENAFMGGALHLWSSIMVFLDPGDEPTERDFRRMEMIQKEFDAFGKVLEARAAVRAKTAGNA